MTRVWALNSKLYGFCRNSFLAHCGQGSFLPVILISHLKFPELTQDIPPPDSPRPQETTSVCSEATSPSFGLCIACLLQQSKAVCPSPFSLNGDSQKTQLYIGLYRAGNRMERSHARGGSNLLNPSSKTAGKSKAKGTLGQSQGPSKLPPQQTTQLWDSHTCLLLAADQYVPRSPLFPPPGHPFLHLT